MTPLTDVGSGEGVVSAAACDHTNVTPCSAPPFPNFFYASLWDPGGCVVRQSPIALNKFSKYSRKDVEMNQQVRKWQMVETLNLKIY